MSKSIFTEENNLKLIPIYGEIIRNEISRKILYKSWLWNIFCQPKKFGLYPESREWQWDHASCNVKSRMYCLQNWGDSRWISASNHLSCRLLIANRIIGESSFYLQWRKQIKALRMPVVDSHIGFAEEVCKTVRLTSQMPAKTEPILFVSAAP